MVLGDGPRRRVRGLLSAALLLAALASSTSDPTNANAAGGCSAAGCGGHGECIDGGNVCMCEEGWFGRNCSGALQNWKEMHKLEHNFYEHDSFKSRYVLAAHHLRGCRHIVEVGGYRTPISSFLNGHHLSVTTIDPYIRPYASDTLNGEACRVRHLPTMFADYPLTGEEDCFVYMGLDYYDEDNQPLCGTLKETVHRFERVVVDYAAKYPTGAACFKALELPSAFERVANVVLEFEGNRWPDLSGSWLPTGLTARVLYVLQHRNTHTLKEQRRAFANPQEYSGAGAEAGNAAEKGGGGGSTQAGGVAEALARAGGAVETPADEAGMRGWSLKGLEEGTGGGGGASAPAGGESEEEGQRKKDALLAALPEVPDNWRVCADFAKKRDFDSAEVYWNRLLGEKEGGIAHVSQYFEYAVAHLTGHGNRRAAELLQMVVSFEPKDPRGYNNLALALENDGDYAGARQVAVEGLKHAPEHNGLNYNLGKLLLDEDNFAGAAAHFERAAMTDPGNADIHFYLGTSLRQIPGRESDSELAYAMVNKIDKKYVLRYINTDTNDQYWEFVKDEQEILHNLTQHEGPACSSNLCRLKDIVSELRETETTLSFIGDRQLDGRKAQLRTGYMKHSFAYGSTFYQSWLKVIDTELMRGAAAHARETGQVYAVLGSSIGWHVFYGALSWDLPARGWEILCSQVDISTKQVEKHLGGSPMKERILFQCLDALQANLEGVHILILAFSRDVNLGVVLNQKMADQLAPGALVVAWSRILDAQPEFERAAVYKVAVSWSQNWGMYVYRRK